MRECESAKVEVEGDERDASKISIVYFERRGEQR